MSVIFGSDQTEMAEGLAEVGIDNRRAGADSTASRRNDDKIAFFQRHFGIDLPIRRPHDPLTAVTDDGIAEFRCRRKANPVDILLQGILGHQSAGLEILENIYADSRRYVSVLAAVRLDEQMIFSDCIFLHGRQPHLSETDSCSALCASSLENFSAVGGAHSLHEAVNLGSVKFLGLVCLKHCTFHSFTK